MTRRKKDPKRVAAGKRARGKGKTWERAIVRALKVFWPKTYRGHQDSRGGFGGGEGCDIEGTPYYIEARHEAEYNWRKHLREALTMRAKRKDERPVVLVAKDDKKPPGWKVGQPGTPPIVIMLWDDWVALVRGREKYEEALRAELED